MNMGTVDGRGYDGQQEYTICDAYMQCHSILTILKPFFFNEFNRFVVFTTRSGA